VARVRAYRAAAAALAAVSALGVLAVQVSQYNGHGALAVPALEAAGVAPSLTVHAGLPAVYDPGVPPPQEVRSAGPSLRVRSTQPTQVRATVHRYATADQAAGALTAWQSHQDDLVRRGYGQRVVVADGVGTHEPSLGTLRLARSRGPVLLVLELDDDTLDYRDAPATSRERLMAAAPAAVGILFDAAPAVFDVTLVWWA
jgi:hypothetical protein